MHDLATVGGVLTELNSNIMNRAEYINDVTTAANTLISLPENFTNGMIIVFSTASLKFASGILSELNGGIYLERISGDGTVLSMDHSKVLIVEAYSRYTIFYASSQK